jgi:nicotinate phosphoribosyltransferase
MIVSSMLDQDTYKLTMQQAVCQLYPYAQAEYTFINRGKTSFPDGFGKRLRNNVDAMADLRLTESEKSFLEKACPYLTPVYIDFLSGYRFNPEEVEISQDGSNLSVTVRGYWYKAILWEVPLMALISELFFKLTGHEMDPSELDDRNKEKAQTLSDIGVKFADFGTRRRFSFLNHHKVIRDMIQYAGDAFVGTSNLCIARQNNLKPIGTQAHEFFQFHAAKYGFRLANMTALEKWVRVYHGDLGIALSDTFTSDAFYQSFGMKYAKLFDGTRHDSGDPFVFADKTIEHYKGLGIDPLSKVIVFSDSLNVDAVREIEDYCRGRIRTSYGIGTNLTNDVGAKPLNIVIKMTGAKPQGCDWIHTVKLSDAKGKWTGDPDTIKRCMEELRIKS